ncbi:MAG: tetratricopeptide repeat protein [Pyrinomonas methylaliphatogenes]|nr:tetratricopeptide repeat protein [Pyrinomonas methylaliphatogenes]
MTNSALHSIGAERSIWPSSGSSLRRAARRGSLFYWLNLGIALLSKGVWEKAEEALKRVIELDNKSQSAYFHLAKLHEKREDEAAAREAYEKAIELDPHTHLAQRAGAARGVASSSAWNAEFRRKVLN